MQKKLSNQPSASKRESFESLSIIAEFSRELSLGKSTDSLTRVLGLLCEIFEAPYGLITLLADSFGSPAILAFYAKKKRNSYQFTHLEDMVPILIKHSPPHIAGNILWIRDLAIEGRTPKFVSECNRVLSFSLVFETKDFGRVFVFLKANAKLSDERLAVSEILIDILSLYCSQRFSSVRDNYARTASLRRITSLSNSAYTLDETLRAINQEIKKATSCRACWALLPDKNMLYSVIQIDQSQNSVEWSFDDVDQDKARSWIKKCASPLLLSSIEVDQNLGKEVAISIADSEMCLVIPIRSEGDPLGFFSMILPSDLDFKEIWPLIEEIEGPISVAISNAALRERLARSNRRLEEANKEIASLYSNLEKLYEQLGSKLAGLLEDQIEILLYTSQDCVHCTAAERITQEALRLYKGQVSYRKVDVLSEEQLWKGRKIMSVPAIAIGDELLLGVPDPTRLHTLLVNLVLSLIKKPLG